MKFSLKVVFLGIVLKFLEVAIVDLEVFEVFVEFLEEEHMSVVRLLSQIEIGLVLVLAAA